MNFISVNGAIYTTFIQHMLHIESSDDEPPLLGFSRQAFGNLRPVSPSALSSLSNLLVVVPGDAAEV